MATNSNMGAWTRGLEGSSIPIAEAVLVSGVVLSAASLVILLSALLEFTGVIFRPRFCGGLVYTVLHSAVAILWLPIIGLASFLLSEHHYSAIAFVAAGGVFFMLHLALVLTQLCWWCCGGASLAALSDHPKSALLTAPSGDTQGGLVGSGGAPHHGGAGATGGDLGGATATNAFRATYGLLPGSSVFAYHIFIPEEETRTYTGLQSGPQQQRPTGPSPSRKKVQPLISLQSTGQRQQVRPEEQQLQQTGEQHGARVSGV